MFAKSVLIALAAAASPSGAIVPGAAPAAEELTADAGFAEADALEGAPLAKEPTDLHQPMLDNHDGVLRLTEHKHWIAACWMTVLPSLPLTAALPVMHIMTTAKDSNMVIGTLEKLATDVFGITGEDPARTLRRYVQWGIWTGSTISGMGFWGMHHFLVGKGRHGYLGDDFRRKYRSLSKLAMSVYSLGFLITMPTIILECMIHDAMMQKTAEGHWSNLHTSTWQDANETGKPLDITLWTGQYIWAVGFWLMYIPAFDSLFIFKYQNNCASLPAANATLHTLICKNGNRCDLHDRSNGGLECCKLQGSEIAKCPTIMPVLCEYVPLENRFNPEANVPHLEQACYMAESQCHVLPGGRVQNSCHMAAITA